MKLFIAAFSSLFFLSCSVHKSDGREFFEQNRNDFAGIKLTSQEAEQFANSCELDSTVDEQTNKGKSLLGVRHWRFWLNARDSSPDLLVVHAVKPDRPNLSCVFVHQLLSQSEHNVRILLLKLEFWLEHYLSSEF